MKKILNMFIFCALCTGTANAFNYQVGDFRLKLDASGSAGIMNTKFFQHDFKESPSFLGDWDARAEMDYDISGKHRVGVVYAIDAIALDEDQWMHELFALWQVKDLGRVEIGFTSAVAHKLGIGVPDVGGMRVNEEPLFYKKIAPKGTVIADTVLSTGHSHEAIRLNLVSSQINHSQFGVGISGLSDEYKMSIDGAYKLRYSSGKVKTALSIGGAFMNDLDEHHADIFSAGVTADWRAQASVGFNMQYNSFVWGTSIRGIYDYNAVGPASDGISAGTGVSYDLLNSSVSLSYIMSDTGIWHNDAVHYMDNTVIGSFRYKYNENIDVWMSLGTSSKTPFVSVAMRASF